MQWNNKENRLKPLLGQQNPMGRQIYVLERDSEESFARSWGPRANFCSFAPLVSTQQHLSLISSDLSPKHFVEQSQIFQPVGRQTIYRAARTPSAASYWYRGKGLQLLLLLLLPSQGNNIVQKATMELGNSFSWKLLFFSQAKNAALVNLQITQLASNANTEKTCKTYSLDVLFWQLRWNILISSCWEA